MIWNGRDRSMEQLYELSKRFPEKFIHDNPSGFGDYIQHSVIRQRLLSVLGAYSTDIVEIIYDGEIITGVILQLSCVVDGQEVSVVEAGDVEKPDNWKTNGARMKDAMSDAIKRCAMSLGVGLHLWSQINGQDEYFLDKQIEKAHSQETE
tara:strand:+ start:897 stop:1346 length:450 start_codon:yes stop_codon:yes gene_type:complete